jgi:hypothetical protein
MSVTRRKRPPPAPPPQLPESYLRFKPSTDPNDLRDHLRVVSAFVGEQNAMPMMNEAGLSVAGWYRQALELSAKGPALRVVK